MTTRINALVVTVEPDWIEEDAWTLMVAIEQFKGVLRVDPHWAAPDSLIAQMRLDNVVELHRR